MVRCAIKIHATQLVTRNASSSHPITPHAARLFWLRSVKKRFLIGFVVIVYTYVSYVLGVFVSIPRLCRQAEQYHIDGRS